MVGRWSYLAGGMAITVKGRQASRAEASVLVLAPHSTFLDSVIVYVTNMCSVIVRQESMDNYAGSKCGIFGKHLCTLLKQKIEQYSIDY